MIPTVERADPAALQAAEWDITAIVGAARERARASGHERIALWMTASNCPGCLMLDAQIVGDAADRLYAQAVVVKLWVGDVRGALVRTLRIGESTLTSPGVPTICVLADLEDPGGASLSSLSLGPLSAVDAHGDIKKLVEGNSRWVPEAAAAVVQVCQGGFCTPLGEGNRFRAESPLRLG